LAPGVWERSITRASRLDRTIAIKVLPHEITTSPQARERFHREARTVAALEHPNICTLDDVGETPDHRDVIVMELLDGETLHERLTHGPLALPQLIDLGIALLTPSTLLTKPGSFIAISSPRIFS
jgi:serine/threonine protein kinase